jgi:Family of unknown function (DUF6527)
MTFVYRPVERLPKKLDKNVVYHSEEFEVAATLCACGCGHRVTLLVPDGHQVFANAGKATVRPSIAVCDAPCKSHYFITDGRVEWLPAFSEGVAASVMHGQIARHAMEDAKRRSWRARARAAAAQAYSAVVASLSRFKSLFWK